MLLISVCVCVCVCVCVWYIILIKIFLNMLWQNVQISVCILQIYHYNGSLKSNYIFIQFISMHLTNTLWSLLRDRHYAIYPDIKTAGKESACHAGDLGSIPGLGRFPGEGNGYPLHYSDLENSHGLYSPWGRKELDMTERLGLLLFIKNHVC